MNVGTSYAVESVPAKMPPESEERGLERDERETEAERTTGRPDDCVHIEHLDELDERLDGRHRPTLSVARVEAGGDRGVEGSRERTNVKL